MLLKSGNWKVPLEYAISLYNSKNYKQAFFYFKLLSSLNHPVAFYFIGIMTFHGLGCKQNKDEAFKILDHLSKNGIECATEFIEDNFS